MSDAVVVALIGSAQALLVVVAGGVGVPMLMRRLNAIREQVANDHKHADGTPINLRDDLDDKHDENRGILLTIQRDVMWIARQLADHDNRLDGIEDTLQTKGKTDEHPDPHNPS